MATQVAAPATPVGLTASSQTVDKSVLLMLAAFMLVPASFAPLAIAHGGALIVVTYQHFYIVSAISLLAAVVAGALALTTVQIGLYRVLFMCLGFMSMGAIFAVHGLTTPGILVPNLFARFAGSAVAASAYLSTRPIL